MGTGDRDGAHGRLGEAGPAAGATLLRRFGKARTGATLIEFALLMLPFFILLFAIFEVALLIWGGLELDNATADAGRLIRTGQAQAAHYGAAELRQEVCRRVSLLMDCASRLRLDVRTFPSFAMTAPSPLDGEGRLKQNFAFDPGSGESIVLMTTFYEWPLLTVLTSLSLGNMADGNVLISASAAFRNEAFPGN